MKNAFFLVLGLLVILGSIFLFVRQDLTGGNETRDFLINNIVIEAEIVDTPELRQLGLSGRENLPEGRGMFFIFDEPSRHGFWMKDMNFAIDIVWIDEEYRIIGIEKEVVPETFPYVFRPEEPVKYVLELPAGFTSRNNIEIGAVVQ